MKKIISEFEPLLFIWQIIILAGLLFIFYLVYLFYKFLRKNT
jgi:accessory gene regulator protein AgrB